MSARDPHTPRTETTPECEQTLISGARPIIACGRLSLLVDAPMRAGGAEAARYRPLDGAARNQFDLF